MLIAASWVSVLETSWGFEGSSEIYFSYFRALDKKSI